ncbi:MAG: hypothetical protein JWQ55_6883 [Rhodopila sp.]|nr:hypothetical protein [Rhodopila sp.]
MKIVARYYEDQWPAYVSVAERRVKAEREAGKLRKKGSVLAPVTVEGRKIASTFWGKAWCDNLESYRDYENRLERGRSYARNGLVIDLQIAPHAVTALVCGSSLYTVKITIAELPKAQWKSICADCAGGIDSLVELLQGRFSKGVMERICRQGTGLFPKPAEIKFSCSCLDHASMCKHVAGALYGVGARLDARPELLFRLRAVNENDLVANIGEVLPMSKQGPDAGKVLEADDMAALFGLDMGDTAEPAEIVPQQIGRKAPVAARKRNEPGLKPVAPKVVSTKQVAQVGKASPRKAAPQPVEWWKPATSKQVGEKQVSSSKPIGRARGGS